MAFTSIHCCRPAKLLTRLSFGGLIPFQARGQTDGILVDCSSQFVRSQFLLCKRLFLTPEEVRLYGGHRSVTRGSSV